jgi:RhtB (resistance to homoserine/threonine) family protein
MHWFLLWAAWASINLAATISPGPAFAMTVKTAIAHNRRAGIIQSIGLGFGVATTLILIATGLALLLAASVFAFEILKYAGAAYLIYLGVKALRAKKTATQDDLQMSAMNNGRSIGDLQALRMGYLTNLLNPKGLIFFCAMTTQFITPLTPAPMIALFALTAMVIETGWFSFVTLVLTNARVKTKFLSISHWVERICGGLLIALGLKLVFTEAHA